MRSVWKGAVTFGLVHIPVELYSAVRSAERVSFRLLHKQDNSPIKYERVCQREGEPVPWKDIVKGYEYEKGRFVVLDDDDFEAAAVQSSKTFEILDFVDEGAVDPRYFETPYYILPSKGGEKPYALLREAVRESGMIGIGKITMRTNSHHLAAIKVVDEALVLEIMRFADELIDVKQFTFPAASSVRPQELQMAQQLIANLAQEFAPERYHDDYNDNLRRVIRAKLKGKKITVEEVDQPKATNVVDLMSRLQESLAQGKRKRAPSGKTATRHTKRRGAGRKSA